MVISLRNPKKFRTLNPSNFRTQGSFIHINSGKIFERDLLSSDSVAQSATQKPWVFFDCNGVLRDKRYWCEKLNLSYLPSPYSRQCNLDMR